jgi:hypothetical protein
MNGGGHLRTGHDDPRQRDEMTGARLCVLVTTILGSATR